MNQLTGVSSEILTFLASKPSELTTIGDISGELHYIVKNVVDPSGQCNVVRLRVEDISGDDLQREVLYLLQIGAGRVEQTKDIVLVKEIVERIYDDRNPKETLVRILEGTIEALRAQKIKNPHIHIARAASEVEAELDRLLGELDPQQ